MKAKILEIMREIAADNEQQLTDPMTDQTVLLASGLDSLGFAILVARLEEELGFDPFVEIEDAVYPETFGDFVAMYQRVAVQLGKA